MAITKMVSLDTSSTVTGFAYFENAKKKAGGVLNHKKEKDSAIRYEDMCLDIISHLNVYKPSIVVIERPPLCKDPKTLINLSEIVGCVKGWALLNYAEFVEYDVNTWRKLIAEENEKIPRKRDDCKIWDIEKFFSIFNTEPIDDNEADAALIGIARINELSALNTN